MKTNPPTYRLTIRHGNEAVELQAGRHFRLRPFGLEDIVLPQILPVKLDDFLRVAISVYVADGITRRGRRGGETGWSRSPELIIEVAEPDFWNSECLQHALKECLDFLGDDDWQVRFVPDPTYRKRDRQLVFPYYAPAVICLFSGGLDSVAGLAARLSDRPKETLIPVIVRHRSGLAHLVRRQLAVLRERYGRDHWTLPHVVVGAFVKRAGLRELGISAQEKTHRCRAFLFAAVGGVVAALTDASEVEVYESGIGAVNLPLRRGMTGSMATRSSHPRFLKLMGDVLTQVTNRRVSYRLPFLGWTKGELVAHLTDDGLQELARSTVSCIHYPLRRKSGKQCGVCPGCIFRRQALFTAGIQESPDASYYDLFGSTDGIRRVPSRHFAGLKAFLMQVTRLSPLETPDGMPACLRDHLIRTGIVARGDERSLKSYGDLFLRYRCEWLTLAAAGQERGWTWVNMVTPRMAV